MAKIKLGGIAADVSGKEGGRVYVRNRYGLYMRNFTPPANVPTIPRTTIQNYFKAVAEHWQLLTSDQRRAWELFARGIDYKDVFGDVRKWTGQICFIKCGINMQMLGFPFYEDPSPVSAINQIIKITNISFNQTGNSLQIFFTPSPTDGNLCYKVYATPGISTGIEFAKNYYRFIGIMAPGENSGYDIYSYYGAYFGVQTVGKKMFVMLKPVSILSGLPGINISNSCIIQ